MKCICGHDEDQHGQERTFYQSDDSRREVCLECPGYEEPGYPNGAAWHRFVELTPERQMQDAEARGDTGRLL